MGQIERQTDRKTGNLFSLDFICTYARKMLKLTSLSSKKFIVNVMNLVLNVKVE